jgi:GNAT superfamily N-acetyltransferase
MSASEDNVEATRSTAPEGIRLEPVHIETWTPTMARDRLDDVVSVYKAAFLDVFEDDPERAAADRRLHVGHHFTRTDVRVVAALDPTGRLVGFTYAVPGRPGNWWHDVVTSALPGPIARQWFSDTVEIVELHVLPSAQGRGLGRALLRAALDASTERTAALSALDDPALPARHLYTAEGFSPLLTDFRFPGGSTRYAVLVKSLR